MILESLKYEVTSKKQISVQVPSGVQYLFSTYTFSYDDKNVLFQLLSPTIAIAVISSPDGYTVKSSVPLIETGDSVELILNPLERNAH